MHGDDSGGAFEWVGRGTLGGTIPIEIHGSTVVEVDGAGLVTRWRDYFDLKEIDAELPAAGPAAGRATTADRALTDRLMTGPTDW